MVDKGRTLFVDSITIYTVLNKPHKIGFVNSPLRSKTLASNNPGQITRYSQSFNDSFTAILLYVDEMVKTTNNEKAIKDLKRFLSTCFKIKDLEPLKDFLGVEVF